jgi:hypothetical protein
LGAILSVVLSDLLLIFLTVLPIFILLQRQRSFAPSHSQSIGIAQVYCLYIFYIFIEARSPYQVEAANLFTYLIAANNHAQAGGCIHVPNTQAIAL